MFIEFSLGALPRENIRELIEIGNKTYRLKYLTRNLNRHFTCAVFEMNSFVVLDDLSLSAFRFDNIDILMRNLPDGCFFFFVYIKDGIEYNISPPHAKVTQQVMNLMIKISLVTVIQVKVIVIYYQM